MKDAYPYRFYRDGDIAEARAHRNSLCELLGIPVPKSVPKAERPPGQAASTARAAAANRDDLGYRGSSMCPRCSLMQMFCVRCCPLIGLQKAYALYLKSNTFLIMLGAPQGSAAVSLCVSHVICATIVFSL